MARSDYDPATMLNVWVSVGPMHYLSGADVTVRDAKGQIVGQGKTNKMGRSNISIDNNQDLSYPLKITTVGGYDEGKRFRGRVMAKAYAIGAGISSTKLDLITTAATIISSGDWSYDESIARVRQTLDIGSGAPDYIIHVLNNHIDGPRLKRKVKSLGGFNRLANRIALAAREDKKYKGLTKRYGGYTPKINTNTRSEGNIQSPGAKNPDPVTPLSTSASAVCTPPLGNGQSKASSTEVIAGIGIVAMETLGEVAGIPSPATEAVMGAFLSQGSDPSAQTLEEIQQQLTCISQQIAYLSEQVAYLGVQVSLNNAQQCETKMKTAWQSYLDAIAYADVEPLNADNSSFINLWLPSWKDIHDSCGSAVDTALFSRAGGAVPAWTQLVSIYQNKHGGWLYQSEVQELQEFLAYWSGIENQQFTLRSEYDSYYGYYTDRRNISGFSAQNPTYCESDVTSSSAKFCVWSNNIKSAYPKDIYSDELAIMSNGLAINGYPSTLNSSEILKRAKCKSKYDWGVFTETYHHEFNSRPLNTSNTNTAIETWTKPRVYRDKIIYRADAAALAAYPSDVALYYLTSINSDSSTYWATLPASNVAFGARDAVAKDIFYNANNNTGYLERHNAVVNDNNNTLNYYFSCTGPAESKNKYFRYLGHLLGRSWWSGASTASQYTPPPPPTLK